MLWRPQPPLSESAVAWIYAGGAHHMVLSYAVTTQQLVDWADMKGIKCVVIDTSLKLRESSNERRLMSLSGV